MSRWWLIFAPFAIVSMLTIGCHRGSASAGLDASADTSVVASPCAWPGQRAPSFMSALELQSLIQRCTAQAVEATHPVSRVEVGTSRQMLVYAQLVGGDARSQLLVGLLGSPPVLSAWAITDSPAVAGQNRGPKPAMRARASTRSRERP